MTLFRFILCEVVVATNENQTSSSAVPVQVLGGVEAVAPISVPPTT